jgi:hypothetical protein
LEDDEKEIEDEEDRAGGRASSAWRAHPCPSSR